MRRVGVLDARSFREAEDKLAALVTRGGLGLRASRAVRPSATADAPATVGASATVGAPA